MRQRKKDGPKQEPKANAEEKVKQQYQQFMTEVDKVVEKETGQRKSVSESDTGTMGDPGSTNMCELVGLIAVFTIVVGGALLGLYVIYNPQSVQFLAPLIQPWIQKVESLWPFGESGHPSHPDVMMLTEATFNETVDSNNTLVEFYAPWCGHCKTLKKPYGEAAEILKGVAVLAAVDATAEKALAERFEVKSFPTIKWFSGGEQPVTMDGGRTADKIVNWVKKRIDGPYTILNSEEEIAAFRGSDDSAVIAAADDEDGAALRVLHDVAMADNTRRYARVNNKFAKGIKVLSPPGFALFTKHSEKPIVWKTGKLKTNGRLALKASAVGGDALDALVRSLKFFLAVESLAAVTPFSNNQVELIINPATNISGVLFGADETLLSAYTEVANNQRGKIVLLTSAVSEQRLQEYIGLKGKDFPQFSMLGPSRTKYPLHGLATLSVHDRAAAIEEHVKKYLAGSLEPFFKSEEIPADNSGPVTVVVGKEYEKIMFDSSKTTFLEVYAPWCGHCKQLAPIWEQLGEEFASNDDVVIANLDGTANEAAGLDLSGFPSLFISRKGSTSIEKYSGDREFDALKDFVLSAPVDPETPAAA